MKPTAEPDPRQLDLFDWADQRPTAQIFTIIKGLAKRMWRERHMEQPHYPNPCIIPWRKRA
ncbi:hypothetical protein SAMN02745157_1511 [Kaistia soli DSM 19436]|uniref:Uncharacterized protein n=1 Tax=Kaistia soli DSM 19436 TaxID=1122133 RepID=A0A1M4YG60_9HYPH|nr:hypothetical protein SAMN02745157_1511 [Kaistia soli DSM 19436]